VKIPYHRYKDYLEQAFGCNIRKVVVDAGFTCPNRDGTVSLGGCAYCSQQSFTPLTNHRLSITEQLNKGMGNLSMRFERCAFLAYFQPNSNTHASTETLRKFYDEALAADNIVGFAIGTRPDCIGEDVLDLLAEFADRTYVQLELGLQTANDQTLAQMNRGHTAGAFFEAAARARQRGLNVCAHIIVGLPGETETDFMHTARLLSEADLTGVKIHNFYVAKGSPLAEKYCREPFPLLTLAEYSSHVVSMLEVMPWKVCVQRLYGSVRNENLIAPEWGRKTNLIDQALLEEFSRRKTFQGRLA
jgi:radical SAM protein (TIGR01212 family)